MKPAGDPYVMVSSDYPMQNYPVRDQRPGSQHMIEDPHLIADYLAHNSSKAAAVFRRYDSLAIYRLIQLSQDLRRLEHRHEQCVENGVDPENPASTSYGGEVGSKVKEYCMRLLNIRRPNNRY
jgi:hypothetical protein